MPDRELPANEGALIVRPEGPLAAEDFAALAQEAEALAWALSRYGTVDA